MIKKRVITNGKDLQSFYFKFIDDLHIEYLYQVDSCEIFYCIICDRKVLFYNNPNCLVYQIEGETKLTCRNSKPQQLKSIINFCYKWLVNKEKKTIVNYEGKNIDDCVFIKIDDKEVYLKDL